MRLLRAAVAAIFAALMPFAVIAAAAIFSLGAYVLAAHLKGSEPDPGEVALAAVALIGIVVGAIAGVDTYRKYGKH